MQLMKTMVTAFLSNRPKLMDIGNGPMVVHDNSWWDGDGIKQCLMSSIDLFHGRGRHSVA
jgi:hypothetical protein